MAHPDNNCALELNYDIWFRVKKFSCLKVCGYESLSRPKNSKSTCTCFLKLSLWKIKRNNIIRFREKYLETAAI